MKIGFTSTIPVELIFAAGHTPVDLNNIFITARAPRDFIRTAEAAGFPGAFCSWVKGIYGVVRTEDIRRVIVVVEGDCSNNQKLAELFRYDGLDVFCFGYPHVRTREALKEEMVRLQEWLGAEQSQIVTVKGALDRIRSRLVRLDRMSFEDMKVRGAENHLWLVSSSDFKSDHKQYEQELTDFLKTVEVRERSYQGKVRLGYVGVPPIVDDLYDFIEEKGGVVVFNEVQRQFAMLEQGTDLIDQYLQYTYPYGIEARLADIKAAITARRIDGIIHYVQSFCSHSIDDLILRQQIGVPLLTIECDLPGHLDGKNKTKLEAFLERWL
jgi:benzoyl-CoA reductase/2-hydroxyglutaryl-CoA dehydratase subunit BcrC/BadD/HgdB